MVSAPTRPSAVRNVSMIVGTGAVYSFDPVGSYEREACRAAGAAQALVQPFLDNQVSWVLPLTMRSLGLSALLSLP
jgi:20S proteasome alpha/beta subunit